MEKKLLSLMLLAVFSLIAAAAPREEAIISPNGNIRIEVTIGDRLQYSVYYGEEQVLKDNVLTLQVGKERFGQSPILKGLKRSKVDEVIKPVVPITTTASPTVSISTRVRERWMWLTKAWN